ncbi:MAG: hypothetical protein WBF17_23610, partial [Phycisphaerae bacterium]
MSGDTIFRSWVCDAARVGGVALALLLGGSLSGAPPGAGGGSTMVVSLDGEWLLATDPANVGRKQRWHGSPRPEAKPTKVPWIIQDAFGGYHGVAWYWR